MPAGIMMKWVVTRGPSGKDTGIVPSYLPSDCNKENHYDDSFEMENNNSINQNKNSNCCKTIKYFPQSAKPDSCLNDLPAHRNSSTPLSSLNAASSRPKKLRTRRERNKALVKRLSTAVNNNILLDIVTPTNSPVVDPMKDFRVIYRDENDQAAILQNILNSSQQTFNEREVKTPDGPSPILASGEINLHRQRAVRRKHSKPLPPRVVHHLGPNDDDESANSLFNSFVFRELTRDVLI
ncbi:uncharacterized protein LOC109405268 isoform X2 [Aedes albopictus]|uniref:Secreted protein n=1 Tax=Aedes albopictus TaxID=7160 RepID=A0ABM1ZRY4_AEDAL